MAESEVPHWLVITLSAIQLFVAIGALFAGALFLWDPSGATSGLSVDLLAKSPFSDYFIPGLVLFAVNGLGSLIGSAATLRRRRYAGEIALALGVFLVAWVLIQIFWLGLSSWLQPLLLLIGLLEVALGRLYYSNRHALL